MFSRILFVCLFVALSGTCSTQRCKWLHQDFRKYSRRSMELLDSMANHYIDGDRTRNNETVTFPHPLYTEAFNASDEEKLNFTVQVLKEVSVLFKDSSVPWKKVPVENFRMVINRQAEGFSKCIHADREPNKELSDYFKALSNNILKRNGHSAKAWELIRKQIKIHLMRTDHLLTAKN